MLHFKLKTPGRKPFRRSRSLDKFLTAAGRSRTTGYRLRQLGHLKTVTICGRPYVTREAVQEFLKRAAAGELSSPHSAQKDVL